MKKKTFLFFNFYYFLVFFASFLHVQSLEARNLDLVISSLKNVEKRTSRELDLIYVYNLLLCQAYKNKSMCNDTLLYHQRELSLALARDLDDRESKITFLKDMAKSFREKGEFDKALLFYKRLLELQTDEIDGAITYTDIALTYSDQGNYPEAVKYYKKAMNILKKHENDSFSIFLYTFIELDLGDIYRKMKDFENAEYYLLDGLKKIQKNEFLKGFEWGVYYNLGLLYRDKGEKALADDYFNKASKIYKKKKVIIFLKHFKNKIRNNVPLIFLAVIAFLVFYSYLHFYYTKKKQLKKAENYYNLALTYSNQGDYEKAVVCFEEAMVIFRKYGDWYKLNQAKIKLRDTLRKWEQKSDNT